MRDHPRACGEHCAGVVVAGGFEGSSPRLRGTQQLVVSRMPDAGIIPALAGNTQTLETSWAAHGDHPRACGEHMRLHHQCAGSWGSSPRLRGTHVSSSLDRQIWGIIPALAGNTPAMADRRIVAQDHPRACGEHGRCRRPTGGTRGSSPRLRGTRADATSQGHRRRIIPALAGNTRSTVSAVSSTKDHPRACGEHPSSPYQRWSTTGSSPRLRGTRRHAPPNKASRGIIPALAGNTTLTALKLCDVRDHPRACGEHPIDV